MSRYRGPAFKKSRRYGFSTLENNKEFAKGKKRTSPPGASPTAYRKKLSNYGLHLYEKQKVRYMYGISERQFKNTFRKAGKMKGNEGLNFLILLESRLDNQIFRMGASLTRRGARQLVNHGHILVDGKKINIPSYILKPEQTIEIKESSKKNIHIIDAMKAGLHRKDFIEVDLDNFISKYLRFPERDELSSDINELLIVEYYNK